MEVAAVARALRTEAAAVDERRLLVLAGDRERGYDALTSILDRLEVPITETTLVGPSDRLRCDHVPGRNADRLLGTTRTVVALDAHRGLEPNALGAVVGAVDGGGLLLLLAPSLDAWPDRRDEFDESLAAPPFSVDDVTGRFRRRLVETLRAHRGIAIVDLERGRVESDGLTRPAPRRVATPVDIPPDARFPAAAFEACRTSSQVDALLALESLLEGQQAVVLEADRGRGKSSATGLAAACLAVEGEDVLVTAPAFRNAEAAFDRATELLETLGGATTDGRARPRAIETAAGGRIRYAPASSAVEAASNADLVIVDEAAALPVSRLSELLVADRIAFATTIRGYEGAGRGFSVRFRDRLEESRHEVTESTLLEPIRYAAGDPIEVWAFRALLLDARPPVDHLVADAAPETSEYRALDPASLVADEHLLREAFGLLVLAHYRTEPNDLARVLDAPNLETRALCHDGHVVSVALLAREGDLPEARRAEMYEGGRIRGNMVPDVLTSQLRDEAAGAPAGLRIVRIATHHAVRSRGLGSLLLARVRGEFAGDDRTDDVRDAADGSGVANGAEIDWLGTGFGATPGLLEFWNENGYAPVHCSTTRNDASGEYSAVLFSPIGEAGRDLHDRHARRFVRRFPATCSDALDDLDPDVARALLRGVDADPPPFDLSDDEWRIVAGAAYGPGLFDVDPGPFRALVVRYLLESDAADDRSTDRDEGRSLTDREERLLVSRVLQAREWPAVADLLGYHSPSQCMRALGDALRPLVDRYGNEAAIEVRDRFGESD